MEAQLLEKSTSVQVGETFWFDLLITSEKPIDLKKLKIEVNPITGSGLGEQFRVLQLLPPKITKQGETQLLWKISAIPLNEFNLKVEPFTITYGEEKVELSIKNQTINPQEIKKTETEVQTNANRPQPPLPLPKDWGEIATELSFPLFFILLFIFLFRKKLSALLTLKKRGLNTEVSLIEKSEQLIKETEKKWKTAQISEKEGAFNLSQSVKFALEWKFNKPYSDFTSTEVLGSLKKFQSTTSDRVLFDFTSELFSRLDPVKYKENFKIEGSWKEHSIQSAKKIRAHLIEMNRMENLYKGKETIKK